MSDDAAPDGGAPQRGRTHGVYPAREKWLARVHVDGTRHNVGTYDTEAKAGSARDVASLALLGIDRAKARGLYNPVEHYVRGGRWRDDGLFADPEWCDLLKLKLPVLLGVGPSVDPPATWSPPAGPRARRPTMPPAEPEAPPPNAAAAARVRHAAELAARAQPPPVPKPRTNWYDDSAGGRKKTVLPEGLKKKLWELYLEETGGKTSVLAHADRCRRILHTLKTDTTLPSAPVVGELGWQSVQNALEKKRKLANAKKRDETIAAVAAGAAARKKEADAAAAAAARGGADASRDRSGDKRKREGAADAVAAPPPPPPPPPPPASLAGLSTPSSLNASLLPLAPDSPALARGLAVHSFAERCVWAVSIVLGSPAATKHDWAGCAAYASAVAAQVKGHVDAVTPRLQQLNHGPAFDVAHAAISSADAAVGAAGAAAASVEGYAAAFPDGAAGPDRPTSILDAVKKAADLVAEHVRALAEFEVRRAAAQAEAAAGAAGATGLPPPPTE